MTGQPSRTCPALTGLIDEAIARMQSEIATNPLGSRLRQLSVQLQRVFGRGRATLPFLLWRASDGPTRRVVDPRLKLKNYRVFLRGTDAVAACFVSQELVDAVLTDCIFVMAQERGVPHTLMVFQPTDFGTGAPTGERRIRTHPGGWLSSPGNRDETAEELLAALHDDLTGAGEASRRLVELGGTVPPVLTRATRSNCALTRESARLLLARLRLKKEADYQPDLELDFAAIAQEHPGSEATLALIALRNGIAAKVRKRLERKDKQHQEASAVLAFQANSRLQQYWSELDSCGWLRGMSEKAQRALQQRLVDEHGRQPASLHHALAHATFERGFTFEVVDDNDDNEGYDITYTLESLKNASGGVFAPEQLKQRSESDGQDPDSYVLHVSFLIGRHPVRFTCHEGNDVDDYFEPINNGLAAAGIAGRFQLLPGGGEMQHVVFVDPAVYDAAIQKGVIPS